MKLAHFFLKLVQVSAVCCGSNFPNQTSSIIVI